MNRLRSIKRQLVTAQQKLYHRMNFSPSVKNDIVSRFHKLYYDSFIDDKTWFNTKWFGVLVQKCPFDAWIYQEIIYEQKPDYIIETGTLLGGSASFMASICDVMGHGQVITIDIEDEQQAKRRL